MPQCRVDNVPVALFLQELAWWNLSMSSSIAVRTIDMAAPAPKLVLMASAKEAATNLCHGKPLKVEAGTGHTERDV
jgi:hypothetical protein